MNKVNTIVLYTNSDKAFQKKFDNHLRMIKMKLADVTFIEIENITKEETANLLSSDTKLVIFLSSAEANIALDTIANIMPDLEQQYEAKTKRFVVVKLVPCDNSGYFIDKLTPIPNIPNGEKCISYADNDTMWYEVTVRLRAVYSKMLGIIKE